jgi:excisionase family DNA binding protein
MKAAPKHSVPRLPRKPNLTPEELAKVLKLPVAEVKRMLDAREIPHWRFERLIRFPRDLLEEWLSRREKG